MGSQRSWQGLYLHCYRRSRCLLIFVFLALPLSATTYYVDCNGSDSNNGTSTSTPRQTIAKVADYIQVQTPSSPGEKIAVQQLPTAATPSTRQEIMISDPATVAARSRVQNADPAADYGLTVRVAGPAILCYLLDGSFNSTYTGDGSLSIAIWGLGVR
jgi:hypothetical protein